MNHDEIIEWYGEAVSILENQGYEAMLKEDYSGRGMMGDTIPAIVTDTPPLALGWALTLAIPVEYQYDLSMFPLHTDGFGKNATVYY